MTASNVTAGPHFGFVSVTDLGGAVLIGGYLVLNALGRPLEFHCTEPVKPNRAQQILYGATLEPFVYGEQIAHSLTEHAEQQADLILTDQLATMSVRELIKTPVVSLVNSARDVPHGWESFHLGEHLVCVNERHRDDRTVAMQKYEQALPNWDLTEPFDRIREALSELQKAA